MITEVSLRLPVFFSNRSAFFTNPLVVLAGDVGATKTNLALYRFWQNSFSVLQAAQYHTADFTGVHTMIGVFLGKSSKPDRISLGVAGPVLNGKAVITNLSWEVDTAVIREKTGIDEIMLINDLEATACGLNNIRTGLFCTVCRGDRNAAGNMAVIAPGTGLGEAGLYWDGQYYHPFASEGGHASFSPSSETDIELYRHLATQFGHVSWERLLSGPGILAIYRFLRDVKKMNEPAWLAAKLAHGNEAAVISQFATGVSCSLCAETMRTFYCCLAAACGNLALQYKATGGLFIGGGIVQKTRHLLSNDDFMHYFSGKGRMRKLLERIPVRILLNDRTALNGAAYYGAYR